MKYFLAYFIGIAVQIHSILAGSGVHLEHSDPETGYTWAIVTYSEDDMPWHTAHWYWHFCKFPHHRLTSDGKWTWYKTTTDGRSEVGGLHHEQTVAAIGNVVPQSQAGYE